MVHRTHGTDRFCPLNHVVILSQFLSCVEHSTVLQYYCFDLESGARRKAYKGGEYSLDSSQEEWYDFPLDRGANHSFG